MGLALTESQLYTLIKGALVGSSSSLYLNETAFATTVHLSSATPLPWEHFNPLFAMRRGSTLHDSGNASQDTNGRSNNLPGARQLGNAGLVNGLIGKISSMTMIDRDEVQPKRPLADYGVDSLVSVELRNWIRRKFGAELSLPSIVGAQDVKALAADILAKKEDGCGSQ